MKEKITTERIKDLLYATYNEFENELDYDYISEYKEDLTDTDFNIMLEFLERYIDKMENYINESFK